jgi:hypothetical protein
MMSNRLRLTICVAMLGLWGLWAGGTHVGSADRTAKQLRHVVLFQFHEQVTPAQVDEVAKAFARLPAQIPEIVAFEWGTDVSVEGKAQGFTHGFLVTFKDEAGRDVYLPHPAHQEFVKLVGPRVKDVLVFDYWTQM